MDGLTPAQRAKLPLGLQKAILARINKRKPTEESPEEPEEGKTTMAGLKKQYTKRRMMGEMPPLCIMIMPSQGGTSPQKKATQK